MPIASSWFGVAHQTQSTERGNLSAGFVQGLVSLFPRVLSRGNKLSLRKVVGDGQRALLLVFEGGGTNDDQKQARVLVVRMPVVKKTGG